MLDVADLMAQALASPELLGCVTEVLGLDRMSALVTAGMTGQLPGEEDLRLLLPCLTEHMPELAEGVASLLEPAPSAPSPESTTVGAPDPTAGGPEPTGQAVPIDIQAVLAQAVASPALIACATGALGIARLSSLATGGLPPEEDLRLLMPCLTEHLPELAKDLADLLGPATAPTPAPIPATVTAPVPTVSGPEPAEEPSIDLQAVLAQAVEFPELMACLLEAIPPDRLMALTSQPPSVDDIQAMMECSLMFPEYAERE